MRLLLRMWDIAQKWKIDHPLAYERIIDVYLCEGGKSGGEQGIFNTASGKPTNCIYIYDISSLVEPVEMAREIAHEYGHAVLPGIKGFREPEEWANGYLGEKLFLLELSNNQQLTAEDVMGADANAIKKWLSNNAILLTDKIWKNGVDTNLLIASGQKAMNEYIGINLFFHEALPSAFARGFKMNSGQTAKDSLEGLMFALEEKQSWDINIPIRLSNTKIWIPFDKRWTVSGGKLTKTKGGWSQVQPQSKTINVILKPNLP